MWRFYRGHWRSVPLDLTHAPMVPGLFRELSRLAAESGEDVELYAAEMGISREAAHRPPPALPGSWQASYERSYR